MFEDEEEIKNFVTRQSWGPNGTQSWAFVDNLRSKEMEEEEDDKEGEGMEGVVLEGGNLQEKGLKTARELQNFLLATTASIKMIISSFC